MTHKLHINAHFIVSFAFPVNNSTLSNSKCAMAHNSKLNIQHSKFLLSPIQELEPGATPCRGGRCAAAILADRSSRKTKYFIDYELPPVESNHRKGMPGAG